MANTYLSKTLGTATNRKKFTISLWFKKSSNSGHQYFLGTGVDGNNNDNFSIHSTIQSLKIGGYESGTTYELKTNASLRDNSAWYNAVVSFDSTQSTDTNRLKMYINGEQVTSFATAVYPSLNYEPLINKNTAHNIGAAYNASGFFDGSISHFHFIDGTAYDASAFGETDATTGIWKPKTAPSVTYGTNGFFLKFENSGAFGTDSSGNSNTFTVNGTMTQNIDTPSNVFATLNPLENYYGTSTLSNGNNTQNQSSSSNNYCMVPSTLGFNSGKWYWEMKCVSGHSDNWYGTGITSNYPGGNAAWLGVYANDYGMYGYSYGGGLGASYTGNTRTNQGLSFTAGDIIGVAVDCDNLAIYFSKNGTWMSNASSTQGVPTSGGSKTGSFYTITAPSSTTKGFYFPAVCYYDARAAVQSVNFGNGYFGTTAVSSAGTNASGNGIFEYDVPTGYTALSTKGLNL